MDVFLRRDAEALATGPGLLYDPRDLWRQVDLPAVLTDDGDIDEDKVTAAVTALLADKPHYGQPADPPIGYDLGPRAVATVQPKTMWADVIGPASR